MINLYLILACVLLVIGSLLLRAATPISRWFSLFVFIIAVYFFVSVYGLIGGLFVAIPAGLVASLAIAFLFGKASTKV